MFQSRAVRLLATWTTTTTPATAAEKAGTGAFPAPRRATTWLRALGLGRAALLAALAMSACSDDDVGRCCRAIDGADDVEIPQSVETDNGFRNAIRRDPRFDCEYLTCVAYQGTSAYCTRDCIDERDCPDGFACRTVLRSDPGEQSQIQADDKFCVRDAHQCTE